MKAYLILAVITAMTIVSSCKKDSPHPCVKGNCDLPIRKVRYELYTNENFAGDEGNITFSIFIRDKGKTILDSSLSKMRVKDIPDFNHRIIIEKSVPGNNAATLAVGFDYSLENVGESWHLEDFPAGDTFKLVSFPFK